MKKEPTAAETGYAELLTITEAAGMLRCHPNTIRAWLRRGRIKPVLMGDEHVTMVKKEDIQALRKPLEHVGVIVREDQSAFPVVGIGASSGNSVNYTLAVPAGASNLAFTMSGGTGDADMYVKFGSAPTDSSYDCRPYKTGSNETCEVTLAQPAPIGVMVNGYSSSSTFQLVGKKL